MPDAAYARLLALRTGLRHFEAWSAQQARAAGLTPAHHQLLLAIRGHRDPKGPTIGEIADYLLLRHHSAVGLVDRAEVAGLVRRTRSDDDHRVVRLQLTEDGTSRLQALASLHLEELDRLALDVPSAWSGLGPLHRPHGSAGAPGPGGSEGGPVIKVARVYDHRASRAPAVLVDRLWPRGLAKEDAPFTTWCKAVAPSPELRKWYGHDPERFAEFARRYRRELARPPAKDALDELHHMAARTRSLVLLTATKDVEHSGAVVLRDVLTRA